MGRQNISSRGHCDDGSLSEDSGVNKGNLRAVLWFRIDSGDTNLQRHLETSTSHATYISKVTQNELINTCGEEIVSKIIRRLQASRFYANMLDETNDAANESQLTVALRYSFEEQIREDFFGFYKPAQKHQI